MNHQVVTIPFRFIATMVFCSAITVSCQPQGRAEYKPSGDRRPFTQIAPNHSGFRVVKTRYHGSEGGFPTTQTMPPGVDLVIQRSGAPSATIKILNLESDPNSDLNPSSIKEWKSILSSEGHPQLGKRFPSILPPINAARVLQAKERIQSFPWGKAAVFLAVYGQDIPRQMGNEDLYLVVQGITTDGRYSVRMLIPVRHPQLPESSFATPPKGKTILAVEPSPRQAIRWLNTQPSNAFSPSIQQVESLLSALKIQTLSHED